MSQIIYLLALFLLDFFHSSLSQCINGNNSSDICHLCSFDYYDSEAYFHLYNETPLTIEDCLKKTDLFCQRKILIQSGNLTNVELFDAIYEDLLETFLQEEIILNNCSESNLTIFFSKGDHYVLQPSNNLLLNSFFGRMKINIVMKPLFCSEYNISEICVSDLIPTIYLKCFCFTIIIAENMEIQNLNFNAIDTNYQRNANDSLCLQEKNILCCDQAALENDSSPCFLNNIDIDSLVGSQSLFVLEAIFDDPNFDLPMFEMTNVSFLNFYFGNNDNYSIVSFISIDYFGGILWLLNVEFTNFFFFTLINYNYTSSLSKDIYNFNDFYIFLENFQQTGKNFLNEIKIQELVLENFNIYNFTSDVQISSLVPLFNFYYFQGPILFENITILNHLSYEKLYIFSINAGGSNFTKNFTKITFINGNDLRIFNFQQSSVAIDNCCIQNSTWDDSSLIFQNCDTIFLVSFSLINSSLSQINQLMTFLLVDSSKLMIQNSLFSNLNHLSMHFINSFIVFNGSKLTNIIFQQSEFIIEQSSFTSIKTIWSNLSGFYNLISCVFCGNLEIFSNEMDNLDGSLIISGLSFSNLTIFGSSFENFTNLNYFFDSGLDFSTINFINSQFASIFLEISLLYTSQNTNLLIAECKFENIYLINSNSLTFIVIQMGYELIENSFFSNIKFLAGGNYLMSIKSAVFVVKNSRFYNCGYGYVIDPNNLESTEYGELFYVWTCTNILFDNNSFFNEGPMSLFSGFIYCTLVQNNLTLNGNIFTYLNKINGYHYAGLILNNAPILIMTNNKFNNFQCPPELSFIHNNGAVSLQGDPTYMYLNNNKKLYLTNNLFFDCNCQTGGSLGILNYDIIEAKNVSFFNSSAVLGGGIFLVASSMASFESIYFNYSSANQAHAIYIRNTLQGNFSNLVISNGISQEYGGIKSYNAQNLNFSLIIAVDVTTYEGGGVFHLKSGKNVFESGIFYLCYGYNGGIWFITENGNISISDIKAYEVSANSGGALYIDSAINSVIKNSLFNGSFSDFQGAALFIDLIYELEINNSDFVNCQSLKSGVIYLQNSENDAEYLMNGITCIENIAFSGSCIFVESRGILIIEEFFCQSNINNLLYFYTPNTLQIFLTNGTIENCETNYVIYVTLVEIFMENISFLENNVNFSILNGDTALKISIINSNFSNNLNVYLKVSIPVLFCTESNLNISNISFTQNVNPLNYMHFLDGTKSNISIYFTDFINNLHFSDSFVNLEDGLLILDSNSFNKTQGIVIKTLDVNISIENCSFIQNLQDDTEFLSDLYVSSFLEKVIISISQTKIELSSNLSIKLLNIANVSITGCIFNGNSIGRGLEIIEIFNLRIEKSEFRNLKNPYDGGAAFSLSCDSYFSLEIFINNCIFDSNTACYAGVFSIMTEGAFILNLQNSLFVSNEALLFGLSECGLAGIGYLASESNLSLSFIENNIFIQNMAEFISPTIYSIVSIVESNNTFLNNSDKNNFTNKFSSFPLSFRLENSTIASGNSTTLYVFLMDCYNQTVFFKQLITASLLQPSMSSKMIHLKNSDSEPTFTGQFVFDNIIITTSPNTSFPLEIRVSIFDDILLENMVFIQELELFSRPCKIGEILTSNEECNLCSLGTFSLIDPMITSGSQICQRCVEGAFCPGGDYLMPLPGFWRFDENTTTILPCKSLSICIGYVFQDPLENLFTYYDNYNNDIALVQGLCSNGNTGFLCDSCLKGYGKSGDDSVCSKCSDILQNVILKMVFIIFFVCLYIILNVVAIYKETPPYPANVFTSISKILINHLQRISIISSFKEKLVIDDFSTFISLINILSFANEENLSNDCIVEQFINEYKYFRFFKIYLMIILPFLISLFVIIIFYVFEIFYVLIKKQHFLTLPKIYLTFLISIFLFYLLITKCSLSLINCIVLNESNDEYLYSSLNIQCWIGIHYQGLLIIGFLGILGWGLFFPIVLMFLIRKKLKKQSKKNRAISPTLFSQGVSNVSPRLRLSKSPRLLQLTQTVFPINRNELNPYLFFYRDYIAKCYYWESILFLYKYSLSLLSNLGSLVTDDQMDFLLLGIVFAYTYFLLTKKPFKKASLIYLELYSNFIIIFSRLSAIILNDYSESVFVGFFCSIMFLFLNVSFLTMAGVFFYKYGNFKEIFLKYKAKMVMIYSSIKLKSNTNVNLPIIGANLSDLGENEMRLSISWRKKESIKRL